MRKDSDNFNGMVGFSNKVKQSYFATERNYEDPRKISKITPKNPPMSQAQSRSFLTKENDRRQNIATTRNEEKSRQIKTSQKYTNINIIVNNNFVKGVPESRVNVKSEMTKIDNKRTTNASFNISKSNRFYSPHHNEIDKLSTSSSILPNSIFGISTVRNKHKRNSVDFNNKIDESNTFKKLQSRLDNMLLGNDKKNPTEMTIKKMENLSFNGRGTKETTPNTAKNEEKSTFSSTSPFSKNPSSAFITSAYSEMAKRLKSGKTTTGRSLGDNKITGKNIQIHLSSMFSTQNKNSHNEIKRSEIPDTNNKIVTIKSFEELPKPYSDSNSKNVSEDLSPSSAQIPRNQTNEQNHDQNDRQKKTNKDNTSASTILRPDISMSNSLYRNIVHSKQSSETQSNTKVSSNENLSPFRSTQFAPKALDGPEELHFMYVFLHQQKKGLLERMECEASESSVSHIDILNIDNFSDNNLDI